jgi:hypothetical protein
MSLYSVRGVNEKLYSNLNSNIFKLEEYHLLGYDAV